MKKAKKFLIGVLACFAVVFGVLGMSSCVSNDNEVESSPSYNSEESIHEHNWNETIIQKVGCDEDGELLFSCYCGELYTVAIEASGHKIKYYTAKAPTCTEFGWNAYERCERDGCSYSTYEEISAHGHKFENGYCMVEGCGLKEPEKDHVHQWGEGVTTKEPTCMEKGTRMYTCICNDKKTEAIDELGHDIEQHESKAATCSSIGWKVYETCNRCDYTTYEEIEVDPDAHKYVEGVCEYCQENDGKIYSYLGRTKVIQANHKKVNDNGEEVEYAAELVETFEVGDIRFLQYYLGEIKNCFVQTLASPVRNRASTGEETFTITKTTIQNISKGMSSSISKTNTISISEENKKTVAWDISLEVGASTNTKVGVNVGVKKFGAGVEQSVEQSISLASSYGQEYETVTCNEISNGVTESICESFDVTTINEELSQFSISWNMDKEEKELFYAPCLVADIKIYQIIGYDMVTGEFYTTYFISDIINDQFSIDLLSAESSSFDVTSNYQLSPITEIEIEKDYGKIFDFTQVDGGYSCDGFITNRLSETEIPSEYNNLPIVSIGKNAFKDCLHLTKMVISDGVKSIGDAAFSGCVNLTSIEIGNNVTCIGNCAFSSCTGLNNIIIPDSVTSIGYSVFWACKGLKDIAIGNNVTNIGSSTFYGCENLVEVIIPDNVIDIGSNLFENCSQLTKVVIGNGIMELISFDGCSNLTSIEIGDNVSTIYWDYFSDCERLKYVTIGSGVKSMLISEGVVGISGILEDLEIYYTGGIEDWCSIEFVKSGLVVSNPLSYRANLYLNNQLLIELVIPNTVTEIKEYAFYKYKNLTSIVIDESVNKIGKYAFANCENIMKVTFENTQNWGYEDGFGLFTNIDSSLLEDSTKAAECLTGQQLTTMSIFAFKNYSDNEWIRTK